MLACPSCGHENPDGAKFCMECAGPLEGPARAVPEERKVVTVLFCDLVGFTASSERADPEDVRARIDPYFARLKQTIESYVGTVDKYIGDAVMAVFGAPLAHEDDAERAVRAALRILEDIADLNEADRTLGLVVRIGVNTGEVLVRLGAPDKSQGIITGDAVNTASRLQGAAPEGGIVVGERTYLATKDVFDYEALDPVSVKGKSEPLPIWRAKAARARFGTDLMRTHAGTLVGREDELELLKRTFGRTVRDNLVQLVTLVGEPGVGKSRMVAELSSHVESLPDLVRWRQGRCLPYGDGITFWALGEILKAEAGILETDPPDVAASKIDAVIPEDRPDAPWLRQRLRPLVGIEAPQAAREENFTAWRAFLELLAEARPSVFVFEDLHWADDALLAFLEHLVDYAEGIPLLIVGTARPEVFEKAPAFAQSARNSNRINLAPLTEQETARLIANQLESVVLPADVQTAILSRAGGNPLYAEEFVRLLKDRGILKRSGATWILDVAAEIPIPSGVQGLIAARLDTLDQAKKSMLQDAAVIGKVFWSGAVAQMGGRDKNDVQQVLHELSRKELVRPARRSSMEGESEYSFCHALVRDVSYAQIPRAQRAERHRRAASWIEGISGERVEDYAEILAAHYSTALELARAAGQTEQAGELESPALRFLSLAGERALGLDTAAALSNLERALALAPAAHPQRPAALTRFGEAAQHAGRYAEAAEAQEEAIASFRAQGDLPAAARAMEKLHLTLDHLGDPRSWTLPAEALALLEPLGPSPSLVGALADVAFVEAIRGSSEDAIRFAERALALASELGLPRPARALCYRGIARANLGDPGCLGDFREAIVLATAAGRGREVATFHNNLGVVLSSFEGPAACLEIYIEGIAYAKARGLADMVDWTTTNTLDALVDTGEHDEALQVASGIAPRLEAREDVGDLISVRAAQARIFALRGQGGEVAEGLEWVESAARGTEDPQTILYGLGSAALMRAALGQNAAAASLLAEVEAYPGARDNQNYPALLAAMVRTALAIGDRSLAERLVNGVEPRYPLAEHALVAANAALAEARGDMGDASEAYSNAADRWERFGVVTELGFALLGQGRCLLALARPTEATTVLHQARKIFQRLQADPALAETDASLQRATALSS
jgi:class 3 adenylate cyclase/tetratricopeptide (TPR) repeat protein